jgi:hypothetical protein
MKLVFNKNMLEEVVIDVSVISIYWFTIEIVYKQIDSGVVITGFNITDMSTGYSTFKPIGDNTVEGVVLKVGTFKRLVIKSLRDYYKMLLSIVDEIKLNKLYADIEMHDEDVLDISESNLIK